MAMNELERFRDALTQIADEGKVQWGPGDVDTFPALSAAEAQQLARDALTAMGPYAQRVEQAARGEIDRGPVNDEPTWCNPLTWLLGMTAVFVVTAFLWRWVS